MYCEKCGTKIPDDAAFCAECGEQVSSPDNGSVNNSETVAKGSDKPSIDNASSPRKRWPAAIYSLLVLGLALQVYSCFADFNIYSPFEAYGAPLIAIFSCTVISTVIFMISSKKAAILTIISAWLMFSAALLGCVLIKKSSFGISATLLLPYLAFAILYTIWILKESKNSVALPVILCILAGLTLAARILSILDMIIWALMLATYAIASFSLFEKKPKSAPVPYAPGTATMADPQYISAAVERSRSRPSPSDSSSFGFAVLGFFFPVIGLTLFLAWKRFLPLRSRSAGIGALIGAIATTLISAGAVIAAIVIIQSNSHRI